MFRDHHTRKPVLSPRPMMDLRNYRKIRLADRLDYRVNMLITKWEALCRTISTLLSRF